MGQSFSPTKVEGFRCRSWRVHTSSRWLICVWWPYLQCEFTEALVLATLVALRLDKGDEHEDSTALPRHRDAPITYYGRSFRLLVLSGMVQSRETSKRYKGCTSKIAGLVAFPSGGSFVGGIEILHLASSRSDNHWGRVGGSLERYCPLDATKALLIGLQVTAIKYNQNHAQPGNQQN